MKILPQCVLEEWPGANTCVLAPSVGLLSRKKCFFCTETDGQYGIRNKKEPIFREKN